MLSWYTDHFIKLYFCSLVCQHFASFYDKIKWQWQNTLSWWKTHRHAVNNKRTLSSYDAKKDNFCCRVRSQIPETCSCKPVTFLIIRWCLWLPFLLLISSDLNLIFKIQNIFTIAIRKHYEWKLINNSRSLLFILCNLSYVSTLWLHLLEIKPYSRHL